MMSMTLGRPMMISRGDALAVPFPVAIDDTYLSTVPNQESHQPPDQASDIRFFVCSLTLYVITEEILSTMYSSSAISQCSASSESAPLERLNDIDFNAILRFDRSLLDWEESLPKFLLVSVDTTNDRTNAIFRRQANVLYLR